MKRTSPIGPLPFDRWPALDRRLFEVARRPGDLLEPGGPASRWRPATVAWAVTQYGYWLAWLTHNGLFEPDERPASRCTPSRLHDYLRFSQEHYAPATTITQLAGLKRVLAVTSPDADLRFLAATIRRLPPGSNSDRRARLRTTDELRDFGIDLMEEADWSTGRLKRRAQRYRNGLIIALLSYRPLRRRNLAGLALGASLIQTAEGWRIQFSGEQTKTHRPIDEPMPDRLVPFLERYLTCYRPYLAPPRAAHRADDGALFISSGTGSGLAGHSINLKVGDLIEERFDKRMSLHMFREAVPTTLAIKAPEKVRIAAVINNHADYRTTERWYNLATMMDAANAHLDNLTTLRRESRR